MLDCSYSWLWESPFFQAFLVKMVEHIQYQKIGRAVSFLCLPCSTLFICRGMLPALVKIRMCLVSVRECNSTVLIDVLSFCAD